MCVCRYGYIHICTCVYIYISIYICKYIHMHRYPHSYIHTHMHTWVHINKSSDIFRDILSKAFMRTPPPCFPNCSSLSLKCTNYSSFKTHLSNPGCSFFWSLLYLLPNPTHWQACSSISGLLFQLTGASLLWLPPCIILYQTAHLDILCGQLHFPKK